MLGLRLAIGSIALMAVLTASVGGLALVDFDGNETPTFVELRLGGDGPFWDAVANGAKQAAEKRGANLFVLPSESNSTGVGTLSISGVDGTASCGGDAAEPGRLLHIGMANYATGRVCAQFAASKLQSGDRIVAIVDRRDDSPTAPRLDGFRDELQRYRAKDRRLKWELEVVDVGGASRQRRETLSEYAETCGDAAMAIDFTGGPAADLAVLDQSQQGGGRPLVVSFDRSEAALAAIETGAVAAVVTHDPFQCGFLAVDRFVVFSRSDAMSRPAAGCGHIFVPPQLVEPGTLAEYRSSLKIAAAQR